MAAIGFDLPADHGAGRPLTPWKNVDLFCGRTRVATEAVYYGKHGQRPRVPCRPCRWCRRHDPHLRHQRHRGPAGCGDGGGLDDDEVHVAPMAIFHVVEE